MKDLRSLSTGCIAVGRDGLDSIRGLGLPDAEKSDARKLAI